MLFKDIFNSAIIIILFAGITAAQSRVITNGDFKYLSGEIIVKITDGGSPKKLSKISKEEDIRETLKKLGVGEIENHFKISENGKSITAAEKVKNIYKLKLDTNEDPLELSRKVANLPGVEWAEPNFVREIFYTPSDTTYPKILNGQYVQWGLYKIQAAEAWDINKGNPDVVIAIVDTGIDWDHPDLRGNIWQNLAEDYDQDGHTIEYDSDQGIWVLDPGDLNGIDDDGNGYIDDLVGWDFQGWDGTPDNDPMEDSPTHGTHVAGIASAVSDNVTGVASIGFNCSLMAVKSSQHALGSNYIVNGHQGIFYAAQNGAKVINCSWGGTGFSMAEKAAVDFALLNGALIVASAGNDGNELKNYPASYQGVLSVGRTGLNDNKDFSSSYGVMVDVMAPGTNIYSTWQNDTYASKSGTSMSTPFVAGLAGLVVSHFGYEKAEQVAEQIRVNCDDIYALNPDPRYAYKLGGGRINAFKTLNNANSIAVRATDIELIDQDGDGRLESGETVLVRINFINYLSPAANVTVNAVNSNQYLTMTNSKFNTGAMATLQQVSNTGNEFRFTINANTPFDENIELRLDYSGAYNDFQWISFEINPTYTTIATSNLATTINSTGSIGFNDYPENTQGDGLVFLRGSNILWEGAFMYGTAADKVMDAARISNNEKSGDFTLVNPVSSSSGVIADEESSSTFNDNGAGVNKLGIETEMRTYGYGSVPDNNFIIFKFIMTNKSGADIAGLYAGLFLDLDLDDTDWGDDIIMYDGADNFGYIYDSDDIPTNYYIGASLLTSSDYGFYAIRNESSDVVNLVNNFTEEAKWIALSSGISHSQVTSPQDVSFVVSGGPFTIPNNQSLDVAFVLAGGATLEDLRASIQQSRTKGGLIFTGVEKEKETIPGQFALNQNYPNPFNPSTVISYQLSADSRVLLRVYDVLGNLVATLTDEYQTAGTYNAVFNASLLTSGVYFYRIQAGSFNQVRKMILVK